MKTIQDPEKIKRVGGFYSRLIEAHRDYFDYWIHNTVFHWDFNLSVFFTVFPWILWLKLKKKDSTYRLLLSGLFVGLVSTLLDFWGTVYGLWYYTGKIIPSMPSYIPWDLCLLPIMAMLFLQFKPETSPMLKAFIYAFVSAFAGEPLMLWIGLYVITKWSIFYSFPIYFLLYLAAHKLSRVKHFAEL